MNFLLKDDLNFLMEWWFEFSFESLLRANVFSFIRPADFNSFGDQSQIQKDMLRALGFCFTFIIFSSATDSNRNGKCNYIYSNALKYTNGQSNMSAIPNRPISKKYRIWILKFIVYFEKAKKMKKMYLVVFSEYLNCIKLNLCEQVSFFLHHLFFPWAATVLKNVR